MYDYALKVLRDTKARLEEQFRTKNYDSVEDAVIDRGYILDIEAALDTLENSSKFVDLDRSLLI